MAAAPAEWTWQPRKSMDVTSRRFDRATTSSRTRSSPMQPPEKEMAGVDETTRADSADMEKAGVMAGVHSAQRGFRGSCDRSLCLCVGVVGSSWAVCELFMTHTAQKKRARKRTG